MFSLIKLLRSPPLIGLDIQPDAVRLLQFKNKTVKKVASFPLEEGIFSEGKIKQPDLLRNALQQLVQGAHLSGSFAAIALSAQQVINKRIKLPAVLQKKECEIEINDRLGHYFPGVTEDICFDMTVIQQEGDFQGISLVAARRSQIETYVKVVNEAGLIVNIVDVDAYALMRAMNFFIAPASQRIAVLDVRKTDALFIVYQDNYLFLNHYFVQNKNPEEFCHEVKRVVQLNFSKEALDFYVCAMSIDIIDCLQDIFSLKIKRIDPCKILNIEKIPGILTVLGLAMRGN